MTSESQPPWLIRLKEAWQSREAFRFLVIGAYNTAFGYAAFAGAYLLFHTRLHYLAIMVIAHVLAVTNAFLGHKFLTFRAQGHLLVDFLRFNLTYLGALFVGLLGMPLLVEVGHVHPLVSQAALIALTMVGTYVLHKRVSFRRS